MMNKCWVVKIGSALLTNNGAGIDKDLIAKWAEQIVALRAQKIDIILVSSGSIVEGMKRLGWSAKPNDVHKLQAAAAVGQMGLIQAYESLFAMHDVHTAQILLTRDNLMDAKRYENISATLANLLELGTVPIINENDTVATDEIKLRVKLAVL
jgi:glutamate 5-kinase